MAKRYIIDLSQVEQETLIELTKKGRPSARKVKRANILLLANQSKKMRKSRVYCTPAVTQLFVLAANLLTVVWHLR